MKKISQKITNIFSELFVYREKHNYDFSLPEADENLNSQKVESEMSIEKKNIFPTLQVNLEYLKYKYNTLINSDIEIREFTLLANNKRYSAFLLYIDGMVDSKIVNDFVLKPLMLRNEANTFEANIAKVAISSNITVRRKKSFDLADYILNNLIPQNSVTKVQEFQKIISDVNSGNCALFVETLNNAFSIEVKGFKARSVSNPNNEIVVRGSQEAFVEVIRTNTSMLRRIVNNEDLIIENSKVGSISNTQIAICYMKSIANDSLVAEVKYRINNLDVDYLISSGQLEQLIQDDYAVVFPEIIATERPDKAADHLLEGRVVVIVNGSPYALIMPGVLVDFISSPEDLNLKFQYSNLLRVIRYIAAFLALFLPGLYVAITNYHQELIPTELLFAIAASRETVPFPIIFEILIMEIAFELIREAGLRVPSPIGPTIGIVGALILGEAAVSANIVSPILIIVVAITGICSFAIPDFSLSFTLRFFRFLYIILGYLCGLLGIGLGIYIHSIILSNLKSFGVPYLSHYLPINEKASKASTFLPPIWKREARANFLNVKKKRSQAKFSMKWKLF
mgnify:FL=1